MTSPAGKRRIELVLPVGGDKRGRCVGGQHRADCLRFSIEPSRVVAEQVQSASISRVGIQLEGQRPFCRIDHDGVPGSV